LTGDVGLYDEFTSDTFVASDGQTIGRKPNKRKRPKNAFLEKEQKRRKTLTDRMQKYLPQ